MDREWRFSPRTSNEDVRKHLPAPARPSNPHAFVVLFSTLRAGPKPATGRAPDDLTRLLREQPIVDAAADELRRRWKKILKAGAQLGELDPQRRHKIRIQAKKLRYASEFFGGAFPGKKATRRRKGFVAGLEKLQDALGELNDIAVHEGLSEQIVDAQEASDKEREGRAKKAFAAGRLSGREEARIAPVLNDAERAYRAFAKAKAFWS